MKFKTIFIALLFFGAFMACGSKENKPAVDLKGIEAGKIQDFAYGQKDEFIKIQQAELNKMNMDIKEFETKVGIIKKDERSAANEKIKGIKQNTAKLIRQIGKVKNATESTWDSVKVDFNKDISEVKGSIEQMRTWMSAKIAP